jgi:multiple sugar transport system permease protein
MHVMNQTGQKAVSSQRAGGKKISWTPYFFILPHLIFFLAFLAWPFFYGLYISLFEFDFLRPEYRPFVGLQNYTNLFDPSSIQFDDFWRSMRNTGLFILYSVPPLVILALVLAVLLNGKYPGRDVFRGIYFAPFALSVTVAAVLWRWIFEQGGLFDTYGQRLGTSDDRLAWGNAMAVGSNHHCDGLVDGWV